MAWNYKALYEEARRLLEEQIDRHEVSCGCQDKGDPMVEGPCPGVVKARKFLDQTVRKVES